MNKNIIPVSTGLSVSTLSAYINWANKIPTLSLEKEQELAKKLQKTGDIAAARELIMSHLRLVVKMARGYAGYGLSQEDLIQEGNIGLMKAVKRFDPKFGVRLVSFAIHWIRAEMHEFILKNWRIVKIATTKAQRKLFFNLRKASKKLGWLSNDEVKTVANELNVKPSDVRQMETRLSSYDQSINIDDEEHNNNKAYCAPLNALEDKSFDPEAQLSERQNSQKRNYLLHQAMKKLDQRSRDILQQRWLSDNKYTVESLAKEYNVSAERIRQIEKNAIDKLRSLM